MHLPFKRAGQRNTSLIVTLPDYRPVGAGHPFFGAGPKKVEGPAPLHCADGRSAEQVSCTKSDPRHNQWDLRQGAQTCAREPRFAPRSRGLVLRKSRSVQFSADSRSQMPFKGRRSLVFWCRSKILGRTCTTTLHRRPICGAGPQSKNGPAPKAVGPAPKAVGSAPHPCNSKKNIYLCSPLSGRADKHY